MSNYRSAAEMTAANETIHPVEKQWHYPIMTRYGYVSTDQPQQGFVRSYTYSHPNGHSIKVSTGYSSDYWNDLCGKAEGYWSTLEPHLQSLVAQE